MAKRKTKSLDALEVQPEPTAPLDDGLFLDAAKAVLTELDRDLLERAKASASVTRALRARHRLERDAERTGDSYDVWLRQFVGQVGAAWLLSTVFVRTLEDRGLLGRNRVAGLGALDSQRLFFELAPSLTERDYLLTVFRELSRFPAARALFDTQHNPVWALAPSAASAKQLLELFRLPDASAPAFRFGQSDTRFLGDLYQDLDEAVKKRYALFQTPHFIEAFILDRTLEPAIEHFGLDDTTLIDPTCGSGHFLLGAFERLFERRLAKAPGLDARQAALKALDAVFGADINPYAVAIARFRLTLSFLEKAGFSRLADAPELPLHLAVADSLLHNPHLEQRKIKDIEGVSSRDWEGELFALADEQAARDVLDRQYAALVGNPPYKSPQDEVLRERYRANYSSAWGRYHLVAPFTERFFQLGRPESFVGLIVSNAFMTRQWGKTLIEEFLTSVNIKFLVDSSALEIDGHGTPTIMLFGAPDAPRGQEIAVFSPDDSSSLLQIPSTSAAAKDSDGPQTMRIEREQLAKHPWKLSSSSTRSLIAYLESNAANTLDDLVEHVGISCVTGEDEVYVLPRHVMRKLQLTHTRAFVVGEGVRNWSITHEAEVIFPYDSSYKPLPEPEIPAEIRYLWTYRNVINRRKRFGVPMLRRGLTWYELQELYADKLRTPNFIAFAFVATHNHFAPCRGEMIFNRTAPIIKLPPGASEDEYISLAAYLNSSTACFLMKQVMYPRDGDRSWKDRYEFTAGSLRPLPVPPNLSSLIPLARRIDELVKARDRHSPEFVGVSVPLTEIGDGAESEHERTFMELTSEIRQVQEAIDWAVYKLCGLIDTPLEEVDESSRTLRAFEYVLREDDPTDRDAWFGSVESLEHEFASPTNLQRERIRCIRSNAEVCAIEDPKYKRPWRDPAFFDRLTEALTSRVLDLVESNWPSEAATQSRLLRRVEDVPIRTVLKLADLARLLDEQSVPFLSAYLFKEAGIDKLKQWVSTWDVQRARHGRQGNREETPRPPRFSRNDYQRGYYQLRGELNAPKERFITYPGCESDEDGEPVYGWAGWNHLERAQALAALYQDRKDREGWETERLAPMLAGLLELIPWVKQWHNEPSDEYGGMKLGDYFESFLNGECQRHGLTREDLESWRPPETKGRRKKRGARA